MSIPFRTCGCDPQFNHYCRLHDLLKSYNEERKIIEQDDHNHNRLESLDNRYKRELNIRDYFNDPFTGHCCGNPAQKCKKEEFFSTDMNPEIRKEKTKDERVKYHYYRKNDKMYDPWNYSDRVIILSDKVNNVPSMNEIIHTKVLAINCTWIVVDENDTIIACLNNEDSLNMEIIDHFDKNGNHRTMNPFMFIRRCSFKVEEI